MLGHGRGIRAAKLMHGTVGFRVRFFLFRPADALLSSEPRGGQGNLATHTTVCFCLLFFVMEVILISFWHAFSARHFPPLAGLWVVPAFHFVLVFALCRPPRHGGSLWEGLMLVSLVLAPVFSVNSPFFVSPPSPR